MVFFERWFNSAPFPDAEYITNDRGKKFWINWTTHFGSGPRLDVYHRGRRIGTVESIWNEEEGLDLADIIIFERYCKLRQHGLGKAMMKTFIDGVKKQGARHIWGFIQPHEGSTKEYLIDWYKRQGFVVYEAKPGIYHVLLKLRDD